MRIAKEASSLNQERDNNLLRICSVYQTAIERAIPSVDNLWLCYGDKRGCNSRSQEEDRSNGGTYEKVKQSEIKKGEGVNARRRNQ